MGRAETVGNTGEAARTGASEMVIILVMLLGAFVAILNETFLNVSLPTLSRDLGVSAGTVQWVTSGYLLVIGVLVPISAFLIGRYTTRQLFFVAMSLFSAGTLLAALAPSFVFLLAGRIVQAAGKAIVLPLLTTVILALIPPERRGSAMGTLGIVILVAPAIGPTVSGWILGVASWRALFVAILPISLAILAASYFVLRNVTENTSQKVDVASFGLSILGFGGIVLGASLAGEGGGLAEPLVIAALGCGVVGLALFVWRQFALKEPMLDLRTFRFPMFSLSVVALVAVMMSLFASLIIIPIYLQQVRAFSPLEAGLVLMPGGLLLGAMSPVTGRLFDRFGVRRLAPPGLVLMAASLVAFAFLTTTTAVAVIIAMHCVFMFGISMVMMPVMTNGLNELPASLYAHGTAIMNTVQQVAAALGTALLVTVLTTGTRAYLEGISGAADATRQALATNAGVVDAFSVSAVLAAVALVISFFMRRSAQAE